MANKATSNWKNQQIFSSSSLIDIGIYLREGLFKTDIGIGKLHSFQSTHWVLYTHECYFDTNGCWPLQKLSKFFYKTN